ncbi:membrane protein [Streptomyces sp. WM6378]|nr:membrane protein [Streptomyces sp. WM6378]
MFIASFLNLTSAPSCSGQFCPSVDAPNAWDSLSLLMSMYLAGIIGAVLVVVGRSLPQPKKVAGLDLTQFGVAFTVFAAWTAFWTIIDAHGSGAGMILGLIATLALAAAAVASPLVAALKAPLMGAPSPAAPQPYGYPGAAQPAGGYGYPGAQQPYGAQPGDPSLGGQPQAQAQPFGAQAPAPAADLNKDSQAPAAPAGDFAPFWFAVPVARPLYAEDGSPTPIAELAPGTWYLAVDQRGPGLVAQTQDGRRGVLQDTTGIQRG